MAAVERYVPRKILGIVAAALAIGVALRPAIADPLPWQAACIAIQPTVSCTAENRFAIEAAMERCRGATDKPVCHRNQLTQQQAQSPPTILRGGRSK